MTAMIQEHSTFFKHVGHRLLDTAKVTADRRVNDARSSP